MTDLEIQKRMEKHWTRALELYPEDRIVGLFLQGSQNYYMEDEESDVDTKLLIIPSLEDIVLNKQPVSITHILDNDEHMDAKDIRIYWQTMRKGNINFIELMFARVQMVNPLYQEEWEKVLALREDIAFMDKLTSVKAMMGMINEKYFAMEHRYPSRVEIIDKFGGYDPKQLHHLIRVTYFLQGYLSGEYTYLDLIKMNNVSSYVYRWVRDIKRQGVEDLNSARYLADIYKKLAEDMHNMAKEKFPAGADPEVNTAMNEVLTLILKKSIKKEIG
jgi:predicted nucleotidyltransferase